MLLLCIFNCNYQACSNCIAKAVLFSIVQSVCGCLCGSFFVLQHDNTWTFRAVIMKCLWSEALTCSKMAELRCTTARVGGLTSVTLYIVLGVFGWALLSDIFVLILQQTVHSQWSRLYFYCNKLCTVSDLVVKPPLTTARAA